MAESFEQKVHTPTSSKRKQAREQGRIVISTDLVAGVFLLVATVVFQNFSTHLLNDSAAYLKDSLEQISYTSPVHTSELPMQFVSQLTNSATNFLFKLWPFWILCLVAVLVVLAQTRGFLHWKCLLPDWSRINPAINSSRYSFPEMTQRFIFSMLKLTGLSAIAWTWMTKSWELEAHVSVVRQSQAEIQQATSFFYALSVGLILWGGCDYLWRWLCHEKSLRMSARELADEHKQSSTDPRVKQAAQSMRNQWSVSTPLNRESDLLITNGLADGVLLRYQPDHQQNPVIVARERGASFVMLMQRCMQLRIFTYESKELTDALLRIDSSILPVDLWPNVAKILAAKSSIPAKKTAVNEPATEEGVSQ